MRKAILFILISLFIIGSLSAETVLASSNIPVNWNLNDIEVDEGVEVTFVAVGDNSKITGVDSKTLAFGTSGMYGVGQFNIEYKITSLNTANVYISGNGDLVNSTDPDDKLSWSLKQKQKQNGSWKSLLSKDDDYKRKVIFTHYPSSKGITSSGELEFELQTENLLTKDLNQDYSYSTTLYVTWEGIS